MQDVISSSKQKPRASLLRERKIKRIFLSLFIFEKSNFGVRFRGEGGNEDWCENHNISYLAEIFLPNCIVAPRKAIDSNWFLGLLYKKHLYTVITVPWLLARTITSDLAQGTCSIVSLNWTWVDLSYCKESVARFSGLGWVPHHFGAVTFNQILFVMAWDAHSSWFWMLMAPHLLA